MIRVSHAIQIPDSEVQFDFVRSSGPGGQNVNKVASAVHLRFDLKNSTSLPEDVRKRLERLARNRITEDGVLIIEAKQFRTQEQNRQDAIDRLVRLVREAIKKPKLRKRTEPSAESKRRRLEGKRRRSEIKRLRGPVDE